MSEKIVLASTSPYRKELLNRLGLAFTALKPNLDEDSEKKPYWSPLTLAQRLAYLKAASLIDSGTTIIGGDQLVSFKGQVIGKPHTESKALETLKGFCGEWHELITAICILHERRPYSFVNITRLKMKNLSDAELKNYIAKDKPLDCAGSYKIETTGLFLFDEIITGDFSAIQGLPLMQTGQILESLGYKIFE